MSSPFHVPQSKADADPRRWVAFVFLLLASFMNLMDVTIVNVALPSMQENLGASPSQIEWVVAAYVLAFALGLLPFGRLGDIVGRKGMFLIGVGLFTLGSLLCGIAPSIETLIGARVLQGLAASAMTPQVLAIAQVSFPPEEKGLMFSLFGLAASLASVCGPIIGGALIAGDFFGLDWRPIFLVNIPIGVLAVIAGALVVVRVPPHPGLRNDYLGIGIFGLAMVLLVFPLIEGRTYGWPWWVFVMIAASVVLMAAFYFWERHRHAQNATQLLPLELLRNRSFLLGTLITTIFASGIPGFFIVVAIFLQTGFGLTPLESGLTTVPFSLGVMAASLLAGRFGSRFLRRRVATGALLLAVGMAYMRFEIGTVGDSVNSWALLPPLVIAGIGLGTTFGALFQSILAGVPHRDAGSGAGSLQAFQQAGGALGVALVGEIFFTWLENAQTWGATSKSSAFVNAASNAIIYEIVVFLLVAALVPFLKALPKDQGQQQWQRPVPVEG
jgi:EmrB/QacA subfamily drug resistance transporter